MECICVICDESPRADLLRDLADYGTIFYNLTSFEIFEWEGIHLLKVCDVCEEKLLQYDVFRTLCINVCTKLRQTFKIHLPSGSPLFLKLKDNESDCEKPVFDDKLPNKSKPNIDCRLQSPATKSDPIEEIITKDEAFGNEDNGVDRKSNDAPENEKGRCHLCGKAFRNQNSLEGHIRVHQGLKPALCKLCGKDFIRWHSLKLHMIEKHTERRSDVPRTTFPCDIDGCESSFATKHGMLRHRKKHDPGYTKPVANSVVCELCGKTFSSRGSLKKHSYIHTGNMPFHCEICDKRYPTAHKLKEHTMRHQGIKNHTCPQCGLKKTTMHELRVHMNYHTKEKTFPCNYCKKVFLNTGNLATHVKTVHQRLTPFNCTVCYRSFGKKESLKRHIMTHTGERPHECTACGKQFIQLVALRSHAKTHNKQGKS